MWGAQASLEDDESLRATGSYGHGGRLYACVAVASF